MSELVRKQFYMSKSHDALLKERAKELGTTEAQLVREAIETQMGKIRFSRKHLNQWQEERKKIYPRVNREWTYKRWTCLET